MDRHAPPKPPTAARGAYLLTVALLVATVPLLPADVTALGFPMWALGSLAVTAVYAIVVALCLGRDFEGARDEVPGRPPGQPPGQAPATAPEDGRAGRDDGP